MRMGEGRILAREGETVKNAGKNGLTRVLFDVNVHCRLSTRLASVV